MVPNELHVISAKLPAGAHTVRVKFYGAGWQELPRYEQIWPNVTIGGDGRQFIGLREEFDRCNVQGPLAFTRINKVVVRKVKPASKAAGDQEPKAAPAEIVTIGFRTANLPGVQVGDTIRACVFYNRTEHRTDTNYHWRYEPMKYNTKGKPLGYPNNRLRLEDYDIGVIGLARVTKIEGDKGTAEIVSLNSPYKPRVDDMVTATKLHGRLWQ